MKKRKKQRKKIVLLTLLCLTALIFMVIILLNKFALESGNGNPAGNETSRVSRVIDGDTFETEKGSIVRLLCIDAPEKGDSFYSEAKEYLKGIILGKDVMLEKDVSEKDDYGRELRYAYVGGGFVNELIALNGYGKTYPYGNDTKLCSVIQRAEQEARTNKRGMWEQ